MKLYRGAVLRYLLWLAVLGTANANRLYFRLPTTWVFHVSFNTLFLLLPELYSGFIHLLRLFRLSPPAAPRAVIEEAVVENPRYPTYVAPVALAYIVSHPRFNIYKGPLARLRLFGFGLDALPHAATAFGFTNLLMDILAALVRNAPPRAAWRQAAVWAEQNGALVAGSFLAGASALYELGEFMIRKEELRETGGDVRRVNMEWSLRDMVFDLVSNTLGWLAAIALRRRPPPYAEQEVERLPHSEQPLV